MRSVFRLHHFRDVDIHDPVGAVFCIPAPFISQICGRKIIRVVPKHIRNIIQQDLCPHTYLLSLSDQINSGIGNGIQGRNHIGDGNQNQNTDDSIGNDRSNLLPGLYDKLVSYKNHYQDQEKESDDDDCVIERLDFGIGKKVADGAVDIVNNRFDPIDQMGKAFQQRPSNPAADVGHNIVLWHIELFQGFNGIGITGKYR